jgi:AcrR family transcriptional regulator
MDTRTRILQATRELLEAGLGRGVRMSDIARHAGISRQAVYLHFPNRAELLIATTFYLDEVKESDARLAASRSASSGVERLDAFIEAWGGYIPEIYGIGRALIAMSDTDEAAAAAWSQRMQDVREGCEAAVLALAEDGHLNQDHSPEQATDLLWTLLSVATWEQLTITCAWPQARYIETMKLLAHKALVADGVG